MARWARNLLFPNCVPARPLAYGKVWHILSGSMWDSIAYHTWSHQAQEELGHISMGLSA